MTTGSRPDRRVVGLALVLLFALTLGLQIHGGAYGSDLSGNPDEAAHFVTGLMVRDFVVRPWQPPMDFARTFYDHYPKIALGNWPPLFYAVEGAWLAVLPARVGAALLLMALLTALTALLVFRSARSRSTTAIAGLVAASLIAFPLVQFATMHVMTEIPVALLTFAAALAFASYLRDHSRSAVVRFGLLAGAGILVKASAAALALVPPLAALLTRQARLLATRRFYVPALIVALMAVPWNIVTRDIAREGWINQTFSWGYTIPALRFYTFDFLGSVGPFWLLLSVAALVFAAGSLIRRADADIAVHIAVIVGVVLFNAFVPVGAEFRYLVPALPSLAWLFALVLTAVARRLDAVVPRLGQATVAVLLVATFAHSVHAAPAKVERGYSVVAERLADGRAPQTILISSDASGEGAFIAAVALSDRRPGRIIRRASKVLANTTWSNQQYELLARTPGEVLDLLSRAGVQVVVLDASVPAGLRVAHHDLLEQTVSANQDRFEPLFRVDVIRKGETFPQGLAAFHVRTTSP